MVIDLLKQLVCIPSVSGSEETIASFIFEFLEELGFSPKRKGDNIWTEFGTGKEPRILLNSHIDTVPAGEGWTYPPYEATVKQNRIYGRGSNDAKASVAAMITALYQMSFWLKNREGTIVLALACNEESGRQGLETIVDNLYPLNAAIIGEPNNLEICIAQKGNLILNVEWKGQAAHAAHGSADHVLQKAIFDLCDLRTFSFEKKHALLGDTKFELTQFHGGNATNMIPESASASFDLRYTPAYTPQELVNIFQSHFHGNVEIVSDRRRAVMTSSDEQIVKAAQKALNGIMPVGSKTTSDWVFLNNVPTIKIGPGRTEVSHTVDEYIDIDQVYKAVDIYIQTIQTYLA